MLKKLWQANQITAYPQRPQPTSYQRFAVGGLNFAYNPADMRLYQISENAAPELLAAAPSAEPFAALKTAPPQTVVLLPTTACNLRCQYCFASAGAPLPAKEKTLRQALGLLPAQTSEPAIAFFGGEPLLAFGLLQKMVAYAKTRFAAPRFSLTSNGTLISAEIAEFLAREKFSLIISLDGPRQLHDAARPLAGGGGSYDLTLAGLMQIAATCGELAAGTVLRGTFAGGESPQLLRRLKHLNKIVREFRLGGVALEPADLAEGCQQAGQPVSPSDELAAEYFAAAAWYAEQINAGRQPFFHHFSLRLERLRQRKPAFSECGAGIGYFTCDPQGTLHACHRLQSPIGRVASGFNKRAQKTWRDNRFYARKKCAACWLRLVCGGGCRLNSLTQCQNIKQPEPLGCWLTEVCCKSAAYILAKIKAADFYTHHT